MDAVTAASLERSARMRATTERLAALTGRIEAHRAVMPSEAGPDLERWHAALVSIRAEGDQLTAALDELIAESERLDAAEGD